MNKDILMAIESICDDIQDNTCAEDNRKRAEAIALLSLSYYLWPKESATECEEEKEHISVDNSNLPKPGETFDYNGVDFVALGVEQGGLLAIRAALLEKPMPFDKVGINNWYTSSLRKYLNGSYLECLGKDHLLPFTSDLTSDDGMKNYGTAEDYISLLSDALYRKYRAFIPHYGKCWWTITPYSCSPSHAYYARYVHSDGSLNSNNAVTGNSVAPACLINPKFFE